MERFMELAEYDSEADLSPERRVVIDNLMRSQKQGSFVQPEDYMSDLVEPWGSKEMYTRISALIIGAFTPDVTNDGFDLSITDDSEKVAIMLIAAGVDVNSLDFAEATPLQLAALYGREQLVRKLLERGANAFLQGLLGFTALQIAEIRAAKISDNRAFGAVAALLKSQMDNASRLERGMIDQDRTGTSIVHEEIERLAGLESAGPTQAKQMEARKASASKRLRHGLVRFVGSGRDSRFTYSLRRIR